ncbi:MAG: hypothetical protein AAF721_22825 [Myxococcota bacterium]
MLAALGLAVSCTGRRTTESAQLGCSEYLECLAALDSPTYDVEVLTYGSNGKCFENSDAATCHSVCRQRLASSAADVEGCRMPEPNPDDEPAPDGSGYVDCAQVDGPTVGPGEPGVTGFPVTACNPRLSSAGSHKCCSDDPAAAGGALPNYESKNISGGTPLFSGINNDLGVSGLCVRTADIPAGSGLQEAAALDCPIPCNPTWDATGIGAVCGASRVCCQTRELQALDCVQPEGEEAYRPVTGADIPALTDWAPGAHATHQDPGGVSCAALAGGDMTSPVFTDCIAQLSVANQRGFCMALPSGVDCPTAAPTYVSACERL